MKRSLLVVLLLGMAVSLQLVSSAHARDKTGYFVTKDGQTIDDIILIAGHINRETFRVYLLDHNKQKSDIPIRDIKKITLGYHVPKSGCSFQDSYILLRDNREFNVNFDLKNIIDNGIYYYNMDPVTGNKTKQRWSCGKVKEIVFD